tara:strand:+ start:418 stop:843 length:426 start_codon:yes stop_codon:yes gene_type:complete
MTSAINSYIKDFVITGISDYEMEDFNEDVNEIIQELFNNYGDNWENYGEPTLKEFMIIQNAAIYYLGSCDSLTEDMIVDNDWKWWFNIYAISKEWIDDWDELKERCVEEKYGNVIVNLQSNIRRRQATIKVIKKLHLTGSL